MAATSVGYPEAKIVKRYDQQHPVATASAVVPGDVLKKSTGSIVYNHKTTHALPIGRERPAFA